MLVRKQILLEDKHEYAIEELAAISGMSFSHMTRVLLNKAIKTEKPIVRKKTGAKFLLEQAKKAVPGPGDSEYDRYAYDL